MPEMMDLAMHVAQEKIEAFVAEGADLNPEALNIVDAGFKK